MGKIFWWGVCIGVFFILLSLLAEVNSVEIIYGDIRVEEVVNVVDGDTILVNLPKRYPKVIGENIKIRVAGIDTPELRGKCETEKILAIQARLRLAHLVFGSDYIVLKNVRRGKYFRLVAEVWGVRKQSLARDDMFVIVERKGRKKKIRKKRLVELNLGNVLVQEGFAREYSGKTKRESWCPVIVE